MPIRISKNRIDIENLPLIQATIKDYGETVNALGDLGGGTDDIDLTAGNVVTATVSTSEQTFTFSNPPASGTAGSFTLILTNGGSQTVNWSASVDWAGGTAPTLTASGTNIITFTTTNGGTTWYGFALGEAGVTAVSWADWNEAAENTLASDDIFVALMENTNAGGNETGQGGGLTGADLVLTDINTVDGAAGDPIGRDITADNKYFLATEAAANALLSNDTGWTVIVKVSDLDAAQNDGFFKMFDAADNRIVCYLDANSKLYSPAEEGGTQEFETSADAVAGGTTYWICAWSDGIEMHYGFSITKPTKKSDFNAGKLLSFTTITGSFAGVEWNNAQLPSIGYGSNALNGIIHYAIMAKTCLIDNNS